VYVTHDQTEALALSDRIAVLSQGRIEQVGTPSEIYERPATAFVADFIGSSNILTARVCAPGSGASTAVETEHGLALSIPRVPDATGAPVTLLLRPERFQMVAESDGGSAVANRFTARVRDVTYLGEDLHLRVLALEKQPLLVSIKNSKGTRAITSGAAIDLAIDPEDIHVLRR
jgi:ABC-type Fe3+/spermidine/putrescine transport system ATPase subunit